MENFFLPVKKSTATAAAAMAVIMSAVARCEPPPSLGVSCGAGERGMSFKG